MLPATVPIIKFYNVPVSPGGPAVDNNAGLTMIETSFRFERYNKIVL